MRRSRRALFPYPSLPAPDGSSALSRFPDRGRRAERPRRSAPSPHSRGKRPQGRSAAILRTRPPRPNPVPCAPHRAHCAIPPGTGLQNHADKALSAGIHRGFPSSFRDRAKSTCPIRGRRSYALPKGQSARRGRERQSNPAVRVPAKTPRARRRRLLPSAPPRSDRKTPSQTPCLPDTAAPPQVRARRQPWEIFAENPPPHSRNRARTAAARFPLFPGGSSFALVQPQKVVGGNAENPAEPDQRIGIEIQRFPLVFAHAELRNAQQLAQLLLRQPLFRPQFSDSFPVHRTPFFYYIPKQNNKVKIFQNGIFLEWKKDIAVSNALFPYILGREYR